MTLYREIERLVLAGAVSSIRLRADLFNALVREVQANAWGTHFNEGPTWAVNVGGVLVTKRVNYENTAHDHAAREDGPRPLKNGEVFEDKFIERTAKKILVFESGRRVPAGDIKSFSDRRLLQSTSKHRRV